MSLVRTRTQTLAQKHCLILLLTKMGHLSLSCCLSGLRMTNADVTHWSEISHVSSVSSLWRRCCASHVGERLGEKKERKIEKICSLLLQLLPARCVIFFFLLSEHHPTPHPAADQEKRHFIYQLFFFFFLIGLSCCGCCSVALLIAHTHKKNDSSSRTCCCFWNHYCDYYYCSLLWMWTFVLKFAANFHVWSSEPVQDDVLSLARKKQQQKKQPCHSNDTWLYLHLSTVMFGSVTSCLDENNNNDDMVV